MNPDGLSQRGFANVASIIPRIRKEAEEAQHWRETGMHVINLAKAENILIRPEVVRIYKQAIAENLDSSHLSYPKGILGDPALLSCLADFFNVYFNPFIRVEPDHLVTAPGAATCLEALLFNICDPGDGVLVPGPYWNGFDLKFRARSSVEPILVNSHGFSDTFSTTLLPSLEAALQKSKVPIRGLIMTNPHNPFGQCYPQAVLEECVKFCQKHGIHYISDEVYALSEFPNVDVAKPVPFTSALSLDLKALGCDLRFVHIVWSASKDFGSSGIRMACIVSQANHSLALGNVLASDQQTSSLSAIAISGLLTSPELSNLLRLNATRLADAYSTVTNFLKKYDVEFIPVTAGVFIFARLNPKAQTWEDEAETVAKLRDAGVLVTAGQAFHGVEHEKGWVRIIFAVDPDDLKKGLQIIASTLYLDRW